MVLFVRTRVGVPVLVTFHFLVFFFCKKERNRAERRERKRRAEMANFVTLKENAKGNDNVFCCKKKSIELVPWTLIPQPLFRLSLFSLFLSVFLSVFQPLSPMSSVSPDFYVLHAHDFRLFSLAHHFYFSFCIYLVCSYFRPPPRLQ